MTSLTNFRGIELRHFPTEFARLALISVEFQCDVLDRGQRLERIYIGRRFRNDTERLKKLLELHTKMRAAEKASAAPAKQTSRRKAAA